MGESSLHLQRNIGAHLKTTQFHTNKHSVMVKFIIQSVHHADTSMLDHVIYGLVQGRKRFKRSHLTRLRCI